MNLHIFTAIAVALGAAWTTHIFQLQRDKKLLKSQAIASAKIIRAGIHVIRSDMYSRVRQLEEKINLLSKPEKDKYDLMLICSVFLNKKHSDLLLNEDFRIINRLGINQPERATQVLHYLRSLELLLLHIDNQVIKMQEYFCKEEQFITQELYSACIETMSELKNQASKGAKTADEAYNFFQKEICDPLKVEAINFDEDLKDPQRLFKEYNKDNLAN